MGARRRLRGRGFLKAKAGIDSPGAEETDDSNLEALLKELRSVAEEVSLQVFVSSAKASEVITLLDPANCRVAAKGEYLW